MVWSYIFEVLKLYIFLFTSKIFLYQSSCYYVCFYRTSFELTGYICIPLSCSCFRSVLGYQSNIKGFTVLFPYWVALNLYFTWCALYREIFIKFINILSMIYFFHVKISNINYKIRVRVFERYICIFDCIV